MVGFTILFIALSLINIFFPSTRKGNSSCLLHCENPPIIVLFIQRSDCCAYSFLDCICLCWYFDLWDRWRLNWP